ncbi:MAG: DUF1489 family protein, partial [Pseudomonadota bacterium]
DLSLYHITRAFPQKSELILKGRSLYWIIRGVMCVRQPITALESVETLEGKKCKISLGHELISVQPLKHRPFQGWRYMADAQAPKDIGVWQRGEDDDLSIEMLAKLSDIGIR